MEKELSGINKKIIGAEKSTFNGIHFKSKLECIAYKLFIENGLEPEYEKYRYIIWEGLRPTVPFYSSKHKKVLGINAKKLIDITYTPDFVLFYKGYTLIIEIKGFENDLFPLKFKMFRKKLENMNSKVILFELFNKRDILQAISAIKNLKDE